MLHFTFLTEFNVEKETDLSEPVPEAEVADPTGVYDV